MSVDLMADDELLSGFENCTLTPDRFHHREHIRVAWLYLKLYGPLETLKKMSEGLRRFADSLGRLDRYHETITCAYVFLIHERIARTGFDQTWEEFARANGDILDWKDGILKNYYLEDTLNSELAKKIFILPDRNRDSKPNTSLENRSTNARRSTGPMTS